MPDLNKEFDLAVVGTGPGGYWAAVRAGQLGLSTVVIEKQEKIGGTCLLVGCIPTKALLHSADVLDEFHNAKELGLEVGSISVNWSQVIGRKDKIVTKHSKGIEFLFRKNKVELVKGTAKWAGSGKLDVTGADGKVQTIKAKNIIFATGSAARTLPGLDADDRILTNVEILKLDNVPAKLVVIGGGAVGVEFASIYKRFGSDVTLLEMLPRLVAVEDEEISKELEKALKKQGIQINTGAKVERVEKTKAGVKITFTGADGKAQTIEADKVLVAVGRKPVTDGLGLEKSKVELDRGFVKTDGFLRTGEPGVYAIGDIVAGSPQLAHVASAEGLIAVGHIAGKPVQPIDYTRVPNATYCEPQVASVGLTEQACKQRGLKYKVGKFPFAGNSKATILGAHEGFIKIIADEKDGSLLGIHMIGPVVTELVGEATLALQLNAAVEELMTTIHAHPTVHEAMLDAANSVYGLAINF